MKSKYQVLTVSIRFILLSLFILCFIPGQVSGQVNVRRITSNMDPGDAQGLIYALPETRLRVDLEVRKVEYIAGPYAAYAAKFLDMEDVVTSDYDEYSIVDASISAVPVPDFQQLYFAEFTDKLSKEGQSVMMALTDAGLAFQVSGSGGLQKGQGAASLTMLNDTVQKDIFRYFAEKSIYQTYDTIIRRVVVDTITVEKMYLDKKWVARTDEEKAREAADKITQIRQARYNLISGYQEIPYEASTVAYMDTQLQKMEKEYMTLFTGISLTKTFHYTFFVTPKPDEPTLPVCVFSERSGIRPVGASGGRTLNLHLSATSDVSMLTQLAAKRESVNSDARGFYYRIPVITQVSLELSNDLKVQGYFPVSQFGAVTYLPPSVTQLEFYESTGGIRYLKAK
ncbi:MAG: hypothetical protein Kow00127_08630 [Bacteroidales bacterium]